MMAEDLGVEAKEASVREVAKLLPLPELLQSISSIKADYIARQQVSYRSTAFFPLLCENFVDFIWKLLLICSSIVSRNCYEKNLSC